MIEKFNDGPCMLWKNVCGALLSSVHPSPSHPVSAHSALAVSVSCATAPEDTASLSASLIWQTEGSSLTLTRCVFANLCLTSGDGSILSPPLKRNSLLALVTNSHLAPLWMEMEVQFTSPLQRLPLYSLFHARSKPLLDDNNAVSFSYSLLHLYFAPLSNNLLITVYSASTTRGFDMDSCGWVDVRGWSMRSPSDPPSPEVVRASTLGGHLDGQVP